MPTQEKGNLFATEASRSHQDWIRGVVVSLLECLDDPYRSLAGLCGLQSDLCEKLLPFVAHEMLVRGSDSVRRSLSDQVGTFFERVFNRSGGDGSRSSSPVAGLKSSSLSQESFPDADSQPHANHRSIKCVLSLVHHLRQQDPPGQSGDDGVWARNYWLAGLNYLHVSRAALDCSAYLSAVVYADIWCQNHRVSPSPGDVNAVERAVSANASANILEVIHAQNPEEGAACQAVLYEAYQNLGDADALYGCGNGFLLEESGRISHLAQEGKLFKAMGRIDSALGRRCGGTESRGSLPRELMSVLSRAGMYHFLGSYIGGGPDVASPDVQAYQHECAWRLGQWRQLDGDDGDDDPAAARRATFSLCHYTAICSIALSERERVGPALDGARRAVCERLGHGSRESAVSAYKTLSKLRAVSEMEALSAVTPAADVLARLERYDHAVGKADFAAFVEPVLAQRCALLSLGGGGQQARQADLVEHSLRYAEACRANGLHQLALNRLAGLKELKLSAADMTRVEFEETLALWDSGEQEMGRFLLDRIGAKLEGTASPMCPEVLGTLGKWLFELKAESNGVILERYLQKSIQLYEQGGSGSAATGKVVDAYASMAEFCDSQYKQICKYMKSKDYEDKKELMKKLSVESKSVKELGKPVDRDVKTAVYIKEQHLKIDFEEVIDKNEFIHS